MIHRSRQRELMDDIAPDDLPKNTYWFLAFINRYLGGVGPTLRAIRGLTSEQVVIADIGGGDGAMGRMLLGSSARAVICVDLHVPRERAEGIHYVIGDIRRLPLRDRSVAISISSLLFHHLEDDHVELALAESARVAHRGVIINDLVRSRLAWFSTVLVTGLLGNSLVRNDGPLSVKRAFTEGEVGAWQKPRGAWKYKRHLFFRFLLVGKR